MHLTVLSMYNLFRKVSPLEIYLFILLTHNHINNHNFCHMFFLNFLYFFYKILAHRLGLIPIFADPRKFDFRPEGMFLYRILIYLIKIFINDDQNYMYLILNVT